MTLEFRIMVYEVVQRLQPKVNSSIRVNQVTDSSEKVILNVPEEHGVLLNQNARVSTTVFSYNSHFALKLRPIRITVTLSFQQYMRNETIVFYFSVKILYVFLIEKIT